MDTDEYATLAEVDWFNKLLQVEPKGNITQAEFKKAEYTEREGLAVGIGFR